MGGVGKSSVVTGITQQVAPTPPEPPKPSLGDYWRTPGSLDGRVSKAAVRKEGGGESTTKKSTNKKPMKRTRTSTKK